MVSYIIRKIQVEEREAKKGGIGGEAGHLFTFQTRTGHMPCARQFCMCPRAAA